MTLQPMDTAPHDGREVDVLYDGDMVRARWDKAVGAWVTPGGTVLLPPPVGWQRAPMIERAMPLAEKMREAVCEIAIGHPKDLVAMAVTMMCGALVQACCEEGQEANALRASAAHLQRLADTKQKLS